MSKTTYLITGANRGIGFGFVKALSANSENVVIATTRSDSTDLKSLQQERSNIKILQLDAGNELSHEVFAKDLKNLNVTIDVFIGNHGISTDWLPTSETTKDMMIKHLEINTFTYLDLIKIIQPLMLESKLKKIVFISSVAGSIGGYPMDPAVVSYGISKLALNYLMKQYSVEFAPLGFAVLSLHPGLVTTDMGNSAIAAMGDPEELKRIFGAITPEVSVEGMLKVIEQLSPTKFNGGFLSYNGDELPF